MGGGREKQNANLMPVEELNARRTPEQRRADARKAGKASGKARQAKKTMRELANILASSKISDERARETLRDLGYSKDDLTNNALVVAAIFRSAVAGDMKAVDKWQELTAEAEQRAGDMSERIDAARASFREAINESE